MKCHRLTSGLAQAGGEVQTLKGSAGMPPLRQAAIPLYVSNESVVEKVARTENRVQPDNEVIVEYADDSASGHSRK